MASIEEVWRYNLHTAEKRIVLRGMLEDITITNTNRMFVAEMTMALTGATDHRGDMTVVLARLESRSEIGARNFLQRQKDGIKVVGLVVP